MSASLWRILVLGGVVALLVLAADQPAPITIDYPENGSIFPPEITAPTFLWRDASAGARLWRIDITFGDGLPGIRAVSRGERLRIGEIDPRCVSDNNELPKLTPQQAASWTWKPDAQTWAAIKKRSVNRPATVTITGFPNEQAKQPLSRGSVTIETSKDPVGAPIFYRDVPLMPSETEKGVIKPLDQTKLPLINWRLRNVGESRSRLLLTGMYTCANCHSFSLDGKTMGMDLDGPQNDKGMYTLVPIRRQMSIATKDVIEWSTSEGKLTGDIRVGFMSQVSPDGQYVVTMIQGPGARQKGSLNNFYTANFKDYRFLQVFYPTRGILAWYSRAAGKLQPLPGADDPRYVHTNAVWSPDGKYLVFARAEARDAYPPGGKLAEHANDPNETQIQYDLYRIPFNGGKGGQPERIPGASQNGMSNSLSQGFAGRPLDRIREVPQRRADASRQPALHRPGGGRGGAAAQGEHAADEFLAQLFAQWPVAGVFFQEPRALHADVSDAPGRRGQLQPGDPDRRRHGGEPRGEHPGVREHPAGWTAEDRRAGRRILPSLQCRVGTGAERPV